MSMLKASSILRSLKCNRDSLKSQKDYSLADCALLRCVLELPDHACILQSRMPNRDLLSVPMDKATPLFLLINSNKTLWFLFLQDQFL